MHFAYFESFGMRSKALHRVEEAKDESLILFSSNFISFNQWRMSVCKLCSYEVLVSLLRKQNFLKISFFDHRKKISKCGPWVQVQPWQVTTVDQGPWTCCSKKVKVIILEFLNWWLECLLFKFRWVSRTATDYNSETRVLQQKKKSR